MSGLGGVNGRPELPFVVEHQLKHRHETSGFLLMGDFCHLEEATSTVGLN